MVAEVWKIESAGAERDKRTMGPGDTIPLWDPAPQELGGTERHNRYLGPSATIARWDRAEE